MEKPFSIKEPSMAEAMLRLTEPYLKQKYQILNRTRAADFAIEKICWQWAELIEE